MLQDKTHGYVWNKTGDTVYIPFCPLLSAAFPNESVSYLMLHKT